ncbi:uncharacterized protein [Nicotiana sylvestris]|uniref:uncharacterized protein n=1 Tax=Nicotiana sylvestris TaxID=4096 RepID=UPI00388C4ABE
MMRQALAVWGNSSSESEDELDTGDSSMMAVEDDDEDNGNKEVNFKDVQRNLKSYSPKKLMSLVDVLITAFHSLVEDRDSLTLELGESEQTRDDLVAVVTGHKKTIEILRKEKDDLLTEITDLRETIGIGFQKDKTPHKPHNKYVTISDNWPCTQCGNTGHFKKDVQAKNQSVQKNKVFAEKGTVKGSGQQWFMDSGCSKHMTGNTMDFLSLKALQGGSVSFGNGKKGYIQGVGKVGKSLTNSIKNVCYVNGLKYSFLSVSQICYKGNKVEFLSKICKVTNLVTGEIVLVDKRYKNIYVVDFESL